MDFRVEFKRERTSGENQGLERNLPVGVKYGSERKTENLRINTEVNRV